MSDSVRHQKIIPFKYLITSPNVGTPALAPSFSHFNADTALEKMQALYQSLIHFPLCTLFLIRTF